MEQTIKYPYLPSAKAINYVPADNQFMLAAEAAASASLDAAVPTGAAVVKDSRVIGLGTNGSPYHKTHACRRVELGIPTGQGYELCEGCHPKNHSESKALAAAEAGGEDARGADMYLWGHWWCCQPCWEAMTSAGVAQVYLLEKSEVLFNKSNPGNILPKSGPKGS